MRFRMKLKKRARDGVWFVQMDDQRRKSLKTRDHDEARRLYAAVKEAVLEGRLSRIRQECRTTLGEFQAEYQAWIDKGGRRSPSTARADLLALSKLVAVAGLSCRLDRLTQKHLDLVTAAARTPGTANNYLRHIRCVMNKAVAWKHLAQNPFRHARELPKEKRAPVYIHPGDVSRFLASIRAGRAPPCHGLHLLRQAPLRAPGAALGEREHGAGGILHRAEQSAPLEVVPDAPDLPGGP
jgi:hypothetical protein